MAPNQRERTLKVKHELELNGQQVPTIIYVDRRGVLRCLAGHRTVIALMTLGQEFIFVEQQIDLTESSKQCMKSDIS